MLLLALLLNRTLMVNEMRTYEIDITKGFVTPPECQGQIVTRSYAYAADAMVIVERTHDASDNTVTYRAYEDAELESEYPSFEPWNGTPDLGKCLGECLIANY